MFFHPRADGQNVRVEDDVRWREADFLGQQLEGSLTDANLVITRCCLPCLVKRHDDHRRAVATNQLRAVQKLGLTFLQTDAVDDALAVDAFQTSFQHFPVRAVNHDRHANVVIVQQPQEFLHAAWPVKQTFVHVDINDLSTAFDLIASDTDRFVEFVFANKSQKLARSGDVGSFANIHEVRIRSQSQIIKA